MARVALKCGDRIVIDNLEYIIDSVVGDGATCIVYSARYTDHAGLSHSVLLKECYPYADNIIRDGNILSWSIENERQKSLSSFKTAYEKLMTMQNIAKLRNSTSHAFDLFEANGTLYSVTDITEGTTFDKDKSRSLADILKTVLALSKVVQKYHNNGYLHLDIKPGNFLVIPETRELVVLFDLDSVTSIEDIKSGKVKCVPYSKGWAAPEQMQGHINNLCPATDIYSIGAVLFQKLFERDITPADTGLFADWDFDGEIFDKINPKIKRLLREIFQKTLSANIKRRYQNADELITALEEAVKTAEEEMYLISNCPAAKTLFIGRNKELNEIEDAFTNGKKCVIIQGFMGMGKSSVALQYVANHRKEYDAICFSKVYDTLNSSENDPDVRIKIDLARCVINGGTQAENIDQRDFEFKRLVSNNTLIVIDNYDVDRITPYIDELLELNCRIIITTRTIFKNLGTDFYSLSLSGLEQSQLLKLFEIESGRQYQNTDRLFDFFENQQNLTYSIILGAGQIRESCLSLDEYLNDVYAQNNDEAVFYNNSEDQLLNHYRRTMRLHLLSDEQKEVLRTVFVMSYAIDADTVFVDSENGVFDRAVFKSYTGMNLNSLNSLIRSRIITEDEDGSLSLHPSVQEIVKEDLDPNCQNCPHLYGNIKARLDFIVNQCSLSCGVVADTNGNIHDDEEQRIHEMFDIYTWLYESDPQKEKHLYNLFAILTIDDFSDSFLRFTEEKSIWHLDWINREYFVARLYECVQTEHYRALFSDENYINYSCPNYNTEKRALLSFVQISSALIRYISYPYYKDYQGTFVFLLKALMSMYTDTNNDGQEISMDNFEFISDIIETVEPIFKNCCPIDKNGDYSNTVEQAQYYCVAEGYEFDNFPFTVGLCAYDSLWTYLLYKAINVLLMMWIFAATKIQKSNSLIKSRKKWQKEISVELYRIDKGFNQFFDFYGETPNFYGGAADINENLITHNNVYVIDGFDVFPREYVSQIMTSLRSAKRPFYLYSLLLNKQFPLSNVAYDLLFDNNIGKIIANDIRLSNAQKLKLFKKAFCEYIAFSNDCDDLEIKRQESTRLYCMNNNLYLEETRDSYNAIDINNHIVVVWYQIIRELWSALNPSKQFLFESTKMVQKNYIESICGLFDLDLYNECNDSLLKDIPEFNNAIDKALYELFLKVGCITKCTETVVADAIFAFSNGKTSNYSHKQISRAINRYIDAKSEKYSPPEYELLDLLLQS